MFTRNTSNFRCILSVIYFVSETMLYLVYFNQRITGTQILLCMSRLNILGILVGALKLVSEQVDPVSDLAVSQNNSFLSNADPLDLDCLR